MPLTILILVLNLRKISYQQFCGNLRTQRIINTGSACKSTFENTAFSKSAEFPECNHVTFARSAMHGQRYMAVDGENVNSHDHKFLWSSIWPKWSRITCERGETKREKETNLINFKFDPFSHFDIFDTSSLISARRTRDVLIVLNRINDINNYFTHS